MMLKKTLFLICSLGCLSALAQAKRSLYFQVDKNNVQVLPQRFEYALLNEDQLQLGDLVIDSTNLFFSIRENKSQNTATLEFTWPVNLLSKGELAIKNSVGKAIISQRIEPENIKTEGLSGQKGRLQLAKVQTTLSPQNLNELKYSPFLTFCVFRENKGTRLYLCSKEVYLDQKDGLVKARYSEKRKAQVEINGKIVGEQGLIYLNDENETLLFRAFTQTGAFFEIETRMNKIDFKDVLQSKDKNKLILMAEGAEPVDEKATKRFSPTEWMIELEKERPTLYLKGWGDIPLRQDFLIKGLLPVEAERPRLDTRTHLSRVYASSLTLTGQHHRAVKVSAESGDEFVPQENNRFAWTVQDIPYATTSRHYLGITSRGQTFWAGHDIERGLPWWALVEGIYQNPSGILSANLRLQYWIDRFLWVDSHLTKLRWGLELEHLQNINKKEDKTEFAATQLRLLLRFNSGFHWQEPSAGASLAMTTVKVETSSTSLLMPGLFWIFKAPRFAQEWSDQHEARFHYWMASSSGDLKIKSAYEIQYRLYKNVLPRLDLNYGFGIFNYKLDPSEGNEKTQINLTLGTSYLF